MCLTGFFLYRTLLQLQNSFLRGVILWSILCFFFAIGVCMAVILVYNASGLRVLYKFSFQFPINLVRKLIIILYFYYA